VAFAGPKRFFPPPLAVDELPPLDAVILSHDHYDHLDEGTLRALAPTGVRFVAPLGVGAYLEDWGVPPDRITELDWWEEAAIGSLRLVCTPAHHFSGRGALDRDTTLWSSWAILGPVHRVFFGGDTGPLEAANEIRARLGPFDLALLEIGAWDPAWDSIHLGPDRAAELHRQIDAAVLMPIHWGSFEMALHPWDQPVVRLLELAEEQGIALMVPLPGQPVEGPGVDPFWVGRRAP
jgi:L-ascorbate metabolism protein UlaG (beta-lactamase superfamily)